jgi:hypothetical protein
MVNGIHLTLMIGPLVPIPVSYDVLQSLRSVEVTTTAGKASGFQLTFSLSTNSPLYVLFLLAGGASVPFIRVVIVLTVAGSPQVLMDGVTTNTSVAPGSDAGHSTLTVTGEDLTRIMDYIDFSGFPFPAMPAEARVLLMIAKYAMFGIVPMVIPSIAIDVSIPTDRFYRQQGTDLKYIRRLADRVGYVFYINFGSVPGTSVAYWGPEIKVGVPQPALNVDMDAATNVDSLSFNFDGSKKTLSFVYIQDSTTNVPIPIPIPDVNPLQPPLGLIPPLPNKMEYLDDTAKLPPVQALLLGLAKASRTSDVVFGQGSLDVLRYGQLLNARQLVGVRGAGMAFDGLYYVSSVTTKIKRGEIKQDFKLTRNALISITPTVPA